MRKLVIATATNRKAKLWKNKTASWEALVQKLSKTTRTQEQYNEFLKMAKKDQDNIKDVGGFVGGELAEGRRLIGNVRYRDLITLDLDNIPEAADPWFTFTNLYDCAACIYSTHKHARNKKRLRLIIPLSRQVTPEEYEAIARRIADEIGIEYFDDTTYQPSRLMYWPSTACDAEFFFEEQQGEELNVEEILATYANWSDVTSWPYSSRVNVVAVKTLSDKQDDPFSKPGLIGVFNKCFSITIVIEKFLSEIYAPTELNDRYSFINGSTSGGLVIYNDMFAYSHHSTDPCCGKLCNAFDLVRLSLFSTLDIDSDPDVPVNKLPSFKKMNEFASDISEVKRAVAKEAIAGAEEFEIITEDENWADKLDLGTKKELLPTYNNIELIMENDDNLKGLIRYNEMSESLIIQKETPWRHGTIGKDWEDADDVGLRIYYERTYNISSPQRIKDVVDATANKHRYHPIKEYLERLPSWDGIPRVETLFIDYLGAEDNIYTRTVTRKALAAALQRIYYPGTKFDCMITFTGDQGIGKSTLISKLGMDWYSDSLNTFEGKEAMERLRNVWIVEIAELTATTRADVETVKQFISKTNDRYRPAYGHRTQTFPRQCVFFGTTNAQEFLKDTTGNRRFWVIEARKRYIIKNLWDEFDVSQIWAEVKTYFKDEDVNHLSPEVEALACDLQNEHLEESPKAGAIRNYLDKLLPEDWDDLSVDDRRSYIHTGEIMGEKVIGTIERKRVCSAEIWVELFRGDLKNLTRMEAREISDVLRRRPKWEARSSIRFGSIYGTQRGFIKKSEVLW